VTIRFAIGHFLFYLLLVQTVFSTVGRRSRLIMSQAACESVSYIYYL